MVRRLLVVLVVMTVFAALGFGWLQFADQPAYVVTVSLPRYHQIGEDDISEQRIARLRDRKLTDLVITDKTRIVGKYTGRDMSPGEILVDNGTLLDKLPPGRCFASGRCLAEGQTAWVLNASDVDTLGGRVGADDYVDIVLIDSKNKRLTFLIQKVMPLEVSEGAFLFGFTPEQVAILRGITAEGELQMGLLLNQSPNELQDLLKQYSMDWRQVPSGLFPLPTPTPIPQGDQ